MNLFVVSLSTVLFCDRPLYHFSVNVDDWQNDWHCLCADINPRLTHSEHLWPALLSLGEGMLHSARCRVVAADGPASHLTISRRAVHWMWRSVAGNVQLAFVAALCNGKTMRWILWDYTAKAVVARRRSFRPISVSSSCKDWLTDFSFPRRFVPWTFRSTGRRRCRLVV